MFIGNVTGRRDVGGLVGRASGDSELSFSYARANVTGTDVSTSTGVGILIGNASTNAGVFEEMYAEGTVTVVSGTQNKGVIVFAPNPTSSSSPSTFHTITDLWFDNSGGIALIGNESDDWETGRVGSPGSPWVVISGSGGLTTEQMQGSSASANMTGTGGGRWDFSSTGNWRAITIPEDDYPVFAWQAGNEITISGTVTVPAGTSQDGITVVAQVGDITFQDVTTTTDGSGNYSFNAYNIPTQRVFARTTDNNGLPIGAAVEGPWEESATVNLDLQPRSITISDGPNNGWVRDGNEILPVEAGAVLNVNTLRDRLLAGDVTIVAGGDIDFEEELQLNLPATRTLTLKAGEDIVLSGGSNIEATGNSLNLIIWSNANGDDSGMIWLRASSSISTNGGHLWMGGGNGTVTWNDLTVGDDYATGGDAFTPDDNDGTNRNGYNGITLDLDVIIQTGAGNIELNGKSGQEFAGTSYSVNVGIYLGDGSQTFTTSGNISMNGIARLTADQPSSGCSACGFRYGILFHRASENSNRKILITSQSGNIALNGLVEDYTGSTTDRMNSGGVTLFAGTQGMVVSTDSGNIEIMGENQITTAPTGRTARGVWLTGNQTDVISNSGSIIIEAKLEHISAEALALQADTKIGDGTTGDIEIRSNGWTGLSATSLIAGTGELRILPTNTSTTIGLSGATGTLDLLASYFSNNFAEGFSNITIGSPEQSGNIVIGAITLKDPLTLQTTGNVTQARALTGNQNLHLLGDGGVYTLDNTDNSIAALTANTGSLSFINSTALSLGDITATGTVDVRTNSGNIMITGNIGTSDATANAILLAADYTKSAGDGSGGNIIFDGSPAISVGEGGIALLYSGLQDESIGLSDAVDHVRNNVDITTAFDPELTAGLYALYRHQFAGGDGTEGNPYLLSNWQELDAVRNNLSAYYKIVADITLPTEHFWTPIGSDGSPFTGSLDGDDHTIEGIAIDSPNIDDLGLFGVIDGGSIENTVIKGEITGQRFLGMLAGRTRNGSIVTNVRTVVDITSEKNDNGVSDTGGLIGEASETIITFSSTEGSITGNGRDIGGLVGYLTNPSSDGVSEIRQSYSTVNITHTSNEPGTGGLVGGIQRGGSIFDSYATGEVQGFAEVGGLLGRIMSGSAASVIQNSYAIGNVPGSGSHIGGLVGRDNVTDGITIISSYWDTQTSGTEVSAGGVGKNTIEMKMQETFVDWDFADEGIWSIAEGQTYPELQNMATLTPRVNLTPNPGIAGSVSGAGNYLVGAEVTINAFPNTGYSFVEWTEDGALVSNQAEYTFTIGEADRTFIANFSANSYDVTFNANEGSGSMPAQSITFGESAELVANTFTKTGHSFAGWNTQADGSGAPYADEAVFTMNAEGQELFAQWEANSYDVTFKANGGIGDDYTQSITFDEAANLVANTFTKTGHSFAGWNTQADGEGTSYDDEAEFTMDVEGQELFAQWTVNSYDITFNANGGTGDDYTQTITFGQSANLTPNTFTKAGHGFMGWNTEPLGDGTAYEDEAEFTMEVEGITLYAQWKKEFTVEDIAGTFIYDGATHEPLPVVMDGETVLTKDTDYTLSYENNINAGTATVTVTGIGLYTGIIEKTFTITARELTVADAVVTTKVYDGTADAQITGATLVGVVGADDVTLADADAGTFNNANVGADKPVTTTMAISGDAAGNYTLTQPVLTGEITARELTIVVNDAERGYRQEDPEFSFMEFSDQLAQTDFMADITGGSGTPEDVVFVLQTTDIDSPVGVYEDEIGIGMGSIDGVKVNNYNITIVRGTLTITPNVGIDERIAGSLQVYYSSNYIHVINPGHGRYNLHVFSISGTKVDSFIISGEGTHKQWFAPKPGVYLIRYHDQYSQETIKIIVPR